MRINNGFHAQSGSSSTAFQLNRRIKKSLVSNNEFLKPTLFATRSNQNVGIVTKLYKIQNIPCSLSHSLPPFHPEKDW